MNMPVCASCFVVDFKSKELLMIYNKKLGKWLQPGGHLEGDETPRQTAQREVKEETGIEVVLIGNKFQNKVQPFAVENYLTRIGPMLDIQFVGIPRSKEIINREDNNARWISFEKIMSAKDVDVTFSKNLYYYNSSSEFKLGNGN